MWILVVGPTSQLQRPDGAVAGLRQLGCDVEAVDLWESLDRAEWMTRPPTVILVEALHEVDAGRAALVRLRAVKALSEVPVLIAVSVNSLQRLDIGDGFDDFVLVPYVPAELYTRIRRIEWRRSAFSSPDLFKMGALLLNFAAHEAWVDDHPVMLTQQEFALLRFLCEHRGRVFTRDQLLQKVWGVAHYGGSRTVDIHMRRLRMKLGSAASSLQTVRGVGYKFQDPGVAGQGSVPPASGAPAAGSGGAGVNYVSWPPVD